MTNPTPLSPTAQAVLDAYKEASDGRYIDGEWVQDHAGQVAAALRAVADQVVPGEFRRKSIPMSVWLEPNARIRRDLLAIATELENQ